MRWVIVALVLAAVVTAAPTRPDPSHGDLGESASVGVKLPPTEAQGLEIMEEGLKLWKQGEKKNGDESLTKLDAAYGKLEEKQFERSAAEAERMTEEAAVANHVEHPRQVAADSAKEVERGLQMADEYTGDTMAAFNNEIRTTEKQAVAQGGKLNKNEGPKTEKELRKGIKLAHKGVRMEKDMVHFKELHPHQAEALDQANAAPPKKALKTFAKAMAAYAPGAVSTKDTKVADPKAAVSMVELAEASRDEWHYKDNTGSTDSKSELKREVKQDVGNKYDNENSGHPNMAKKLAREVEKSHGYDVDKVKKDAAKAKKKQAQPQPEPQATKAQPAAAQKAPAASTTKELSKAAAEKKIAPYVAQVMKKVDATVDMQFSPVEEQLGFNLHKEAKLANAQAKIESSHSMTVKGDLVERQKEIGLANEISLAAKHAEAQAQKMKDAVAEAQAEHRAVEEADKKAPVPGAAELLQVGESSDPPATFSLPTVAVGRLRPLVQKDAVKIMKHRNKIESTVLKAMRDAEAKINTEMVSFEPSSLRANKDLGDPLDETLDHVSKKQQKHIQKEVKFMDSLVPPPLDTLELVQYKEAPMPKSFDPFSDAAPITYKLPSSPIGNVQDEVRKDVSSALADDNMIAQLTQQAVDKVEADDHAVFKGLVSPVNRLHAYKKEQKIEKKMAALGQRVEQMNTGAGAVVEEGRLPNGESVHPAYHPVE